LELTETISEMHVTAIFESWHVPDGNYPPLSRGQLVRLSFELQPTALVSCHGPAVVRLEHQGDAEYSGVARVLRRYQGEGSPLVVLDAGALRFYVYSPEAEPLAPGDWVEFAGTILLDHYIWVEYLRTYPEPPDLFYNLRVTRIRKVAVPERFISRHERGKALPTRVGPADFEIVEELETMRGQPFDEEFFVIDFDGTGLEGIAIPITFRGADA
jgi:hypothetical protein